MKVVVVGLGKMGLPLACQYAADGNEVVGCDVRPDPVDAVNRGESEVRGEPALGERVAQLHAEGRLSATTDTTAAVRTADVVVMIAPITLDDDDTPDYAMMDAATQAVADGLQPGTLVIYETTMAVGDTRHRYAPMLEKLSGLRVGDDFHVAFSPERVFMGRIFEDLRRYPKIAGGVDSVSTRRAVAFYRAVLDAEVVGVATSETAEFVKLAETTYRDVNIALANELARAGERMGVDAVQAFELANTQPYSHLHTPGAGVGGHCIPVYPKLLMSRAPELRIPALSRQVNDEMPLYVVDLLDGALGGLGGKRVAVLGLTYRNDVKETTLSPAWTVLARLAVSGATTLLSDPWYSVEELAATGAEPFVGDPMAEGTLVLAKHAEFRDIDFSAGGVIVDGRPGGWKPRVGPKQRLYVVGRGWQ